MSNDSSKAKSPKPRKYSIEPVNITDKDNATVKGVMHRLMGRSADQKASVVQSDETPPQASLSDSESHPVSASSVESERHSVSESFVESERLSDSESHAEKVDLAFPKERHPESESLSDSGNQPENLSDLAYEFSYRKGNLRINFDYLDQVVSRLTRNARLLYIYLLRYREGSTNSTIRVNWPMLETKTDISRSVLHKAARELEVAGLAFIVEHTFGKGKEQGFRFRLSHSASHTVDGSHPVSASHAVSADNNRKDLIAKINKPPAVDITLCPECRGAGFYYPQGFDKGVKKCRHERLLKRTDS